MKKDIHPQNNRPVIFYDTSSGASFLLNSTIQTDKKGTFEKKEYPLYEVETSSASHPVYTGENKQTAATGRAERFLTRAKKAQDLKKEKDTGKEAKSVANKPDKKAKKDDKAIAKETKKKTVAKAKKK